MAHRELQSVYAAHPEHMKDVLSSPGLNRAEHDVYWPELKKLLPPKARYVLDFGCGSGTYTEELMAIYPNASVLGVDRVGQMLPSNGRATYLEADLLTQPKVVPGPFDLILAKMVLHYVDEADMNRLCAELVKRLEPGGTLIGSVPHPLDSALHLADMGTVASSQLIKREVAHGAIVSEMWHRPPYGWDRVFEDLLIDNPDDRFAGHDYQLITDSVTNADGEWRRYNFAFISSQPGSL